MFLLLHFLYKLLLATSVCRSFRQGFSGCTFPRSLSLLSIAYCFSSSSSLPKSDCTVSSALHIANPHTTAAGSHARTRQIGRSSGCTGMGKMFDPPHLHRFQLAAARMRRPPGRSRPMVKQTRHRLCLWGLRSLCPLQDQRKADEACEAKGARIGMNGWVRIREPMSRGGFEGANLLLRINGTEDREEQEAVLLSALDNSVSTARGATDEALGVTTLLKPVEYLASTRMKRPAISNINNGKRTG